MKSRSKYYVSNELIIQAFIKAGIDGVINIEPLGAGEFNSIYACDTGDYSYVIKIAPLHHSNLLTYETDMMKQELYFYSLLQANTTIRTPKIFYSDFSKSLIPTPYFIMEKLAGVTSDRIQLSSEKTEIFQERLANMIAQIHQIRNIKFGYIQNSLFDNWYLAISSMVTNLIHDAKKFHHSSQRGKKLLHYIEHNQMILEKVESRMVNFDIWPPNIICHQIEDKIELGLIDLERCFFGDFISDFVSIDFMSMKLEKKSIFLNRYLKYLGTIIEFNNDLEIRYAIMLGYLGLILEVEKYARYSLFHFGWWRNVGASKLIFKQSFDTLEKFTCKKTNNLLEKIE